MELGQTLVAQHQNGKNRSLLSFAGGTLHEAAISGGVGVASGHARGRVSAEVTGAAVSDWLEYLLSREEEVVGVCRLRLTLSRVERKCRAPAK